MEQLHLEACGLQSHVLKEDCSFISTHQEEIKFYIFT